MNGDGWTLMDECLWTNVNGGKGPNGRWRTLDKTTMDVKWNYDGCRTELRRTSNKTATNVGQNRTKPNDNCNNIVEHSTFISSTTMACVRKKRIFFVLLCVFFNYLLLLILPKLLQGLLTTWLQAQKHIGMHSPNANLKTHVQGKQIYVGLHHLTLILYSIKPCVCVCVGVPKT
jgi:hypothetical protein